MVRAWRSVVIAFLGDAPGSGRPLSSCEKSDKSPLDISNKHLRARSYVVRNTQDNISCASPASSTIGIFVRVRRRVRCVIASSSFS